MPYFTNRAIVPLAVGGTPTTVYGPVTFTGAHNGWGGSAFVQTISAANLSAAPGTQVRLTVRVSLLSAGGTMVIYFGQQGAGDAYDFTGTQVHVLFSGVDITGDGSTQEWVSDWITLGESYDESKTYVVAVDNTGTVNYVNATSTGDNYYFKGAGSQASITDKSGFSLDHSDTIALIKTIEIQ